MMRIGSPAVKPLDCEAACYTDDAVSFAVDVMVGVGPEFVRNSWKAFFMTYTIKKVGLSGTDMEIFGDTAAAWGLFTMLVEPVEGGEAFEMQCRFMDVAKRVDGSRFYIADHASVPASPEE
jgi:ketosteroid isomerase-like protein